jgi:phytoene dehydrogenase-like protein
MKEKSVIIIGSGIAGLSAGCYGQMNGYRTHIFEMHDKPGGLCTSWQKEGYTISNNIHWIMGLGPGTKLYRIWEELGAVQGREVVYYDVVRRVEIDNGKVFTIYADIDRLEQHMKELAPEDKNVIEEFIKGVRLCSRYEMPVEKAPELYSPIDKLKMMLTLFPFLRAMRKWGKVSVQEYAKRFRNPLLRDAFGTFGPPPGPGIPRGTIPVFFMQMALSSMHRKVTGYPVGGALAFARAIERRYLDLGGEIHYNSRVSEISVEKGCAIGIRLEDGTMHRADYVISAADGHTTIFDMLDGKYIDAEIRGYYDNLPVLPGIIHVALGVARSFKELPYSAFVVDYPLDEPLIIAGRELNRMMVSAIHNFDPTLAPPGKTVIRLWFPSDYDYWRSLQEEPERYREEKEKIADTIVGLLNKRFPGLAEQVEMRDVATPITYERYTGNWRGSFEGWLPTTQTIGMRMRKTLPGLENFYMAGQWVRPGGTIAFVAVSGRDIIQLICKRDKKTFVTAVP